MPNLNIIIISERQPLAKENDYGRAEQGFYAMIEEHPRQNIKVVYLSATSESKDELLEIASNIRF